MISLSIVIPTLNEGAVIAGALAYLREIAPEAEIVVSDGGSADGTVELAAPLARVLTGPPGRAGQMNRGAAEASGEWLLFLHADTRLPADFQAEIERAQAQGYEAGAFRLRIVGRHPLLPVLAWGAGWRTRRRGIALGDQALFVRRERFQEWGGFPDLPLMEDYAFTRQLKRQGIRLYLARRAVETSGRRWDELGFFRVWWQMQWIQLRFVWGGDAARLRQEYRDVR